MEGLGWTYHLSGQRDAAIAASDNCLVVEPTRAGCLRGRASTALAIGDIQKQGNCSTERWSCCAR